MAQPNVIFIDDDRFYAMHWIERLRERFEVGHYTDAAEAHVAILSTEQLRCLVIDVMMPTPSNVSNEETAAGLETGLWLLRQLKPWIVQHSVPAIIITNRELEVIQSAVRELNLPDGLVLVRQKLDTGRSRLLELVSDMVARWPGRRRST